MSATTETVIKQILLVVLVVGFVGLAYLSVRGPETILTPAVIAGFVVFAALLMDKLERLAKLVDAWRR